MQQKNIKREQRRVSGWLGNLSLSRHLWLAIIPLLVGLVVLVGYSLLVTDANIREQATDDLEHDSETVLSNLNTTLDNVAQDAKSLSDTLEDSEDRLALYEAEIERNETGALARGREIMTPLGNYMYSYVRSRITTYISVSFVDLTGQEFLSMQRTEGINGNFTLENVTTDELGSVAENDYWAGISSLRVSDVWISSIQEYQQDEDHTYSVTWLITPITVSNQRIVGYLILQIDLSPTFTAINSYSTTHKGFLYLVDENGIYLAHNTEDSWVRDNRQLSSDEAQLVLGNKRLDGETLRTNDTNYLAVSQFYQPFNISSLSNPPQWTLVLTRDSNSVRSEFLLRIVPVVLVAGLFIAISFLLISFQSTAIRERMAVIRDGIHQASLGDLSIRVPDLGDNEIGAVGQEFNQSATYVQDLIGELETSAQERVRDLDITAEISREVAGLRDVNLLLLRAVNRIVERFDFYHAQVFFVDDVNKYAVLVASTGEAGQRLLAKAHRLAVGSQSVIGRVTSIGVTVIAGDTLATDVPWQPNVELPETRAEMALPLKFNEQVIGALDIQSKRPDAFSPRDIEVFQVLADQLSVAINNARLLAESEQRVSEIAGLNARLTKQAWQDFSKRKQDDTQAAYRYDLMRVIEDNETIAAHPILDDEIEDETRHLVPLAIRGIAVGSIETTKAELNEDEQSLIQEVANRISLALDNVRLFEETQLTLSESRRLYETSRRISSAADLDLPAIYSIIVEQLMYQETLEYVGILTPEPIPSPRASTLRVSHQWTRFPVPMPWETGTTVNLLQHELTEFYQDTPRVSIGFDAPANLQPDDQAYEPLIWLQQQLSVHSLLAVPLTTGVKWFGIMICASPQPYAFDNSFQNFAIAVGDQLAIAVDNQRLLEEVQTEARRSLALAEASQLANQIGGDFETSTNRLFLTVSDPGNFNRWWFGLLENNNELHKIVSYSPTDNQTQYNFDILDLTQATNALSKAIELREVVLVNDVYEEHPLLGQISQIEIDYFGKHLAVPVQIGGDVLGALLIGRNPDAQDLNSDDIQLANTLASQLSIATENQRLFEGIQRQQQTLQNTIETMPAGVMLLDQTGQVLLTNYHVLAMFGEGIGDGFFAKRTHRIYHTDSDNVYTSEDFPLQVVFDQNIPVTENISVESSYGMRLDILLNANPIQNSAGELQSVVAIFQEITELRELEKALQVSLSETTILYEASRKILGASSMDVLAPSVLEQLNGFEANEIYLIAQNTDNYSDLPPSVVASWPEIELESPLVTDIPLPVELLTATELIFISDMENITQSDVEPEWGLAAMQSGVRAIGVLPLMARRQLLGWLTLAYHAIHPFSLEERRYLSGLADQVAVSLDGIRLYENTERALQSVASLYQSSRRIAEAQGITDVVEIAREELLNFNPDRIDLMVQRSTEETEFMNFAMTWSKESSLIAVPSLPVHPDTGDAMAGFDLFTSEEYYIADFRNEVEHSDLYNALHQLDTPYLSIVSVPLRVGGRSIGRIGMGFLRTRIFTADERQLITTLGDATGYVVENDMLLEQTQESLEETGVLYQAAQTIVNSESSEEIVEAFIDYAASAQIDKTMLISLMSRTWEEPGAVIEISSTWGVDEVATLEGLFFSRDQFPIWDHLITREIIAFDNVETEIFDPDEMKNMTIRMGYEAFGIYSAVIVPLLTSGGTLGCVLFGASEPRVHVAREMRIYKSLADQAAVHLENKQLYEQAEFRARQLATSAEVSRAVTSILDLEQLFPRVVDLIFDAFNYNHVQIFMVDEASGNAYVRASSGEAGRQLLAINHYLAVGSDSVIGRVTSVGEPVIALDTSDPDAVHRPNPYLPETRSEMALPLFVDGSVVGALDVQSNRPQAFDNDDIQALTPLVDQLSVAIQNARLFDFATQRANEMRFLFDVTSTAAAETEITNALESVTRLLIDEVEASAAVVFLYNKNTQEFVAQIIAQRDLGTNQIEVILPEDILSLSSGQGIVSLVAEGQKTIIVSDISQDERYHRIYENAQSGIYLPLQSGGEFIGVLGLESDRLNFFNDDHLKLLQAMSTSLSAVIRNAQLLEEVREQFIKLREVDELKTNFLAAMSHELRTPLNSIIGFSRVILKGIDGPLTDLQEQDIQTIHDSGKHLLGLVNNILDQAKIEAGKMELVLDYFDIKSVVETVMATAVGLTSDSDVKLFTEIPENLPQAYGDEFRTRQILLNLVSNAAKFTEHGSITARARVVDVGSPYIEVTIEDTGLGIVEEDYRHLFEAFQQVDNSTTRTHEGTGLGLPLSRSFAVLQDGDLWFDSEYGHGSSFYVSVPLDPSSADNKVGAEDPNTQIASISDEPNAINQSTASTPVEPHNGNVKEGQRLILVVDDEQEMIDLYQRYLSREGWQIIGTTQPETVETLIVEHTPEMILLDVNMPSRTGWEVLESLKSIDTMRDIPVIICSIDNDTSKSVSLGASQHLIKPFMEGDLISAVKQIEAQQSQSNN